MPRKLIECLSVVEITDDVGKSSAALDILATLRRRQIATNDLLDGHIIQALLAFQNI